MSWWFHYKLDNSFFCKENKKWDDLMKKNVSSLNFSFDEPGQNKKNVINQSNNNFNSGIILNGQLLL